MKHTFLFFTVLLTAVPCHGNAAPTVLTTMKPIHALISSVTEGVTEPDLLLPKHASPHTYTLRPSDMKKLQHADVIFMVSRNLETFLIKPLESSPKATVIELIASDDIKTLPIRTARIWADSDVKEGHEKEHGHLHTGKFDTHIWLDPANAMTIVASAAEILTKKDPAHAVTYRTNAARMVKELEQLDKELISKLAAYSDVPFLVSHDAYQYFEKHYHLNAIGAVTLTPDQAPGAKTINALQETISRHNVVCLFSEPQFPGTFITSIAEATGVGTGILDPEWGALADESGKKAYFSLMRGLSQHLIECFDKKRSLMS